MAPNTSLASPPSSVGASDDGHPKCNHAPTSSASASDKKIKPPKLGPEPTLLSRRQVDALYSLLEAVTNGLNQLGIPYIITGGSLLGAIRQHSILFCDDDIDLAILESDDGDLYERAKSQLPAILGKEYQYTIRPWEGGDKVRLKSCSNVFLDVFVIREYKNANELMEVIGVKKNGDKQSDEYVTGVVDTICNSLHSQGESKTYEKKAARATVEDIPYPIWHFNTRKAVELWPKEVYRECELYPTIHSLKMGPVVRISGPNTPVWLLKRAFGSDCFDVYYQSMSHGGNDSSLHQTDGADLKPLVGQGGQWSQSVKAALSDEHYLPMQPVSRAKRRPTLHDKTTLFEYLKSQSEIEVQRLRSCGVLPNTEHSICSETSNLLVRPRRTVYMDGVMDLFHYGHLHAIEQCAALGDRVIIGITGDKDATGYKRRPIISETDRTAIVKSLKVVDDVVCPCPLVVTEDFMREWDIDLVVHGFADPKDKDRQREFFQVAMDAGNFQEIEYYSKLSTTDIINRIRADDVEAKKLTIKSENGQAPQKKNGINPKWFGAALSAATSNTSHIPYDPFPLELRNVIEPQLRKATKKRQEALNAIKLATGTALYDGIMSRFKSNKFSEEGTFDFDTQAFLLRVKFLQSCSLSPEFDLSRLHECTEPNFKDEMLFSFARERHHFQQVYDEFVRSVCCPYVASLSDESIDEVYYQSFPCVRVVRPGDFSIGPHADCAYGHHPCTINFYIPLTKIEGSASLFLESRPGSEDWRPIEGNYGIVKHFAGAICAHWTPENYTDFTRVSLDFRIIPGPMYNALKCGGKSGGVRDVYRQKEGYYSRCCLSGVEWTRKGPLQTPDARFGFPWTKFNKK